MLLYRLSADVSGKTVQVVVAAENDAQAFERAEVLLDKQLIMPSMRGPLALVEKKPLVAGAGFVIEAADR
ncbi:MAG: hypothetical protein BLM47_06800 [Candidatus Reconcilbacillus cellulovorans]|uniref:DUF3906 domain-containing protein n=1 Tax=Candidatus Reconcilbacillus cellulovorans TaxID=1906605 RepID=A0A2A6E081_9BACL|nr:MAG: hypothetical protein BLM47_06800 [Candidatus Reconcilbacillus cellulovorans]